MSSSSVCPYGPRTNGSPCRDSVPSFSHLRRTGPSTHPLTPSFVGTPGPRTWRSEVYHSLVQTTTSGVPHDKVKSPSSVDSGPLPRPSVPSADSVLHPPSPRRRPRTPILGLDVRSTLVGRVSECRHSGIVECQRHPLLRTPLPTLTSGIVVDGEA